MTGLGLMLAVASFPASALAVTSVPMTTSGGFCTKLSADETAITSGLDNRINTMDKNRTTHADNLASQRATFDATVVKNRAQWDTDRQQNFTALQKKATTSDETAAVGTFEQTVLGLVQTHRSTIDSARDTFRSAEDQLIAGRQNQVNTAISDFQSSISSSESTAQSSCNAGTTQSTVRTTFVGALKSARSALVSALGQVRPIASAVKSLAATRTAAVQAANSDFTAAVKAAGATLKTALHQT